MKPKVFIAKPVPPEVEAYIGEHCEYRIWDKEEPIPESVLLEELQDVDGYLAQHAHVTEELLQQFPRLKVVSNAAVGYDGLDLEAMKKARVLATHTPHVLDETVADLAFALMLSSSRRIAELNNFVKAGKWQKGTQAKELFGMDVHHATLGIVGMGRIGEKIARRAVFGFEMNVLYNARSRKPELEEQYQMSYAELDTLLAASDFVVLIVPLTPETEKLIGERELKLMKKTAFLINCARGKVVDEQALIAALEQGEILGAGLDVFEQEPVSSENPLLRMPHVVTVPHIGSATAQTRDAMAQLAAENLVAGVTGSIPKYVVPELKCLVE